MQQQQVLTRLEVYCNDSNSTWYLTVTALRLDFEIHDSRHFLCVPKKCVS